MSGKIPSSMEELKIFASGLDTISTASFITLTGISLCPGDFEHRSLFISLLTRFSSILWNTKGGVSDGISADKYCSGSSVVSLCISLASFGPIVTK